MPTEGITIVLINRDSAAEKREAPSSSATKVGGGKEPGAEKLKILKRGSLKFIIQIEQICVWMFKIVPTDWVILAAVLSRARIQFPVLVEIQSLEILHQTGLHGSSVN